MTHETEYVAPHADDNQMFSHEAVSRENMPLSICKLPCKYLSYHGCTAAVCLNPGLRNDCRVNNDFIHVLVAWQPCILSFWNGKRLPCK